MVNHPPHIRNSLSSFIPFCEVNGDMLAVGERIENFSLPVCRAFKRKVLDDRLCYQLDTNSLKLNSTSDLNEILFIMDYNEDRSLNDLTQHVHEEEHVVQSLTQMQQKESVHHEALIFVETLGIILQQFFINLNLTDDRVVRGKGFIAQLIC